MTGHQKNNIFFFFLMHRGPRGSRGGPFWAKKGQNPARKPENNPPSNQTATYRETEVIQSYLRTWGTYDPIESGPSDLKKWGLYSRSVKKCRFWGQKWAPEALRASGSTQKSCLFGVQSWWCKKKWMISEKNGCRAKKLHFWPEILHFFTLHLWNPHFFGSDGSDSMGS